jgi:hypothetical protein
MQDLIKCFTDAKRDYAKYVAIRVSMDGFPEDEIIINTHANIDTKLEYYKKTYDDELNHKFAKGIRIVDCTSGNSLDEIEWLIG